ncbi:MAG: ribulose phosphate epimerase, partial [Deltaproteobacteria bacterium]|nr:ribulose phosphate epimerase [Deltaproteobacteria bacterium]
RCCTSFATSPRRTARAVPGTECVAFFEDAGEGFDDVGVCVVP